MRKLFLILCVVITSVTCFVLAGCDMLGGTSEVKKYYLNDRNVLVAEYEDGREEELTNFEEILLDSNFNVEISANGCYIINGILTEISAKYTVRFNIPKEFGKTVPNEMVIIGGVAHEPNIKIEGYDLVCWKDSDGNVWDFSNKVEEDNMTLTAEFVAKEYSITLVNDKDLRSLKVVYGGDANLPTNEDLTKVGYSLKGWSYNGVIVNGTKWSIAENCTLIAEWVANDYKITFDKNGHGQTLADKEVTYDQGYSLNDLTQTGYTFNGWYLDGVAFDNSGVWKLTDDITLKAGWTANTYKATLETKYGKDAMPEYTMNVFDSLAVAPEFTHEQEGYTFVGWTCKKELVKHLLDKKDVENDELVDVLLFDADGQLAIEKADGKWPIFNDCTLTAVWTANKYKVILDKDGGSFANGTVIPKTYTYDKSYSLPIPTKTGYTFDGWFETVDGEQVLFANSGTWNRVSDISLTAGWTANTYNVTMVAYNATFNDGEEIDGGTYKQIEVVFDSENLQFPVPKQGEKQFVGWFTSTIVNERNRVSDQYGKIAQWKTVGDKDNNVMLYAHFQDTIILANVEDLAILQNANYFDNDFIVVNDIDASSLGEWTPVGTKGNPFTGSINGNGKKISGIKISEIKYGIDSYGFLGYTVNAKIENLKLDVNINLPAIISDSYVGGLIGYSMSASVSGVSVSGSVKLAKHSTDVKGYVAGIVGYANIDTIKNCVNSAEVAGQTVAGGVVGYKVKTQNNIHFEGNQNSGKVSAWIAGGIIGDGVFAFAYKCKNTGEVNGKYYAGGIIGRSDVLVIVEQCVNTAAITTNSTLANRYDAAGGIVGYVSRENGYPYAKASLVANSYNTGKVNGSFNAGGIIGVTCYPMQEVKNCYNAGEIIGSQYVGGIVGLNEGIIITQSFNAGAINGKEYALNSTITYSNGTVYDVYIEHCYYNCSISNVCGVGGTATEEKFSEKFYEEDMFWNRFVKVWKFSTDKMPTLVWEK